MIYICFNFNVVLLGNKADLQDARVVDGNEARNVAENLGLKYFETSAATGQNVNESVESLLDQVNIMNPLDVFFKFWISASQIANFQKIYKAILSNWKIGEFQSVACILFFKLGTDVLHSNNGRSSFFIAIPTSPFEKWYMQNTLKLAHCKAYYLFLKIKFHISLEIKPLF